MVAEDEEVADPFGARAQQGRGRGRRGRFETDHKKHDRAVRILTRELQRIEWRIDEAHIRALGLGVEQAATRARHAHHVAEGRENDLWLARNGDRIIEAAHRMTHTGQPGPWTRSIEEGRRSSRPCL